MSMWLQISPLAWAWQSWVEQGSAAGPWAASLMAAALAVVVALCVDRLWGEPPTWLHPVVAMGKLLHVCGQRIAPSQPTDARWVPFMAGALVWCGLVVIFFAAYAALQVGLPDLPWWLEGAVLGVLLKPLLAWRMLKSEVLAVESALQTSLPAGRERLSWLVSRDTSQLDAGTVRESAVETLAENLSDSVLAPLFWFAVLGLPGAAAYRLANTADAMWGYPGWRGQGSQRRYWQWAGKWAARADDVLNWLPARITAGVLVLVSGGVSWNGLRRDAAVTPSPNGGWPMGVMAQALRVRLGKPGVYVLNPAGQVPQAVHVQQAVRLSARVVAAVVVMALCVLCAAGGVAHGL